jgi:ribosome maturation protein SDO1
MSGRASKTQLALPTGIKKLTNIATVRLKKAGVRFEIACYKNTVLAYRDGFEKDLDNVLQTTRVYTNVSKGVFAKEEDLLKAFGTKDEEQVCLLILNAGELQVSEKERKNAFETLFKDAVTVLVEKCVNPQTNRPYPPGVIERALREIHFSVDPMKSAKQQALASIPKLREIFPIKRAPMRFKFCVGSAWFEDTLVFLKSSGRVLDCVIETRTTRHRNQTDPVAANGGFEEIICTADPSAYRACDAFARENTGKTGRVEVLTMAVTDDDGFFKDALESGRSRDPERRRIERDPERSRQSSSSASASASASDASASIIITENQVERSVSSPSVAEAFSGLAVGASSSFVVSPGESSAKSSAARLVPRADRGVATDAGEDVEVLYPRGAIRALPEAFASRRDRFAALDAFRVGWTVELRRKKGSSVVEAVFFDPDGVGYKTFADARREAMRAKK